jgi:hypothetical protein
MRSSKWLVFIRSQLAGFDRSLTMLILIVNFGGFFEHDDEDDDEDDSSPCAFSDTL